MKNLGSLIAWSIAVGVAFIILELILTGCVNDFVGNSPNERKQRSESHWVNPTNIPPR